MKNLLSQWETGEENQLLDDKLSMSNCPRLIVRKTVNEKPPIPVETVEDNQPF